MLPPGAGLVVVAAYAAAVGLQLVKMLLGAGEDDNVLSASSTSPERLRSSRMSSCSG